MSFDRQIDQSIDSAINASEKAVANFTNQTAVPYFQTLWIGIKEFIAEKKWKQKRFYRQAVLAAIVLFGIAHAETTILPKQATGNVIADNVIEWAYYKQKLLSYPLATMTMTIILSKYFYNLGKRLVQLRSRFMLAFERCGLYSKRKLKTSEGQSAEYPFLIKDKREPDGHYSFIFKNPGLPLELWLRNKDSMEATLEESIASITLHKNNPGRIYLKLGDSDVAKMPKKVDVTEELFSIAKGSSVVVGVNASGAVTHNFAKVPHLLAGGATGAGKTVALSYVAYQFISQLDGALYLIDFKGGADYTYFEDMGIEIISDRKQILVLLEQLIAEHHERIHLFRSNKVHNIEEYNALPSIKKDKKLRRIGLLLDELAEVTDAKSVAKAEKEILDEIVGKLSTIARLTRSTGINMMLGTQRPDANVVPGQIKNNVTGRLCGYFNDDVAYRIVLDFVPDPKLPDPEEQPGRFIYSLGAKSMLIQVPYFQNEHIDTSLKMDYVAGIVTSISLDIDLDDEYALPSYQDRRKAKYANIDDEL